jgi:hypothetical protein
LGDATTIDRLTPVDVVVPQSFGACVGAPPYFDIPSSAGYCAEVEWLKNRGIVTAAGCGGGNYCPTNFVQRSGMAQFMKRLGDALSPEILFVEEATGAITVPADPPLPGHCVTTDTATAAYPRSAFVVASFTGLSDASAIAYRGALLYSDDDGATWQPTPMETSPRASSGANQWSGISVTSRIDLEPHVPYRFGIFFRRDDVVGGTTGDLADGRCQLTAVISSRTGTSSPFDAPAMAGEAE